MILSILIPSLESRKVKRVDLLHRLVKSIGEFYRETADDKDYTIENFIGKEVEIILYTDSKQLTVGEKRNRLLKEASGKYISFVDDDDMVIESYVDRLLNAAQYNMDVIVFNAMYYENWKQGVPVYYDKDFLKDTNESGCYKRIPNHLMCVKRELALQARFPHKSFGEDSEYAKRLLPLLKTQAQINEVMYHYFFSHKTSETQCNS